jgi:GntR family transcriptional regulator
LFDVDPSSPVALYLQIAERVRKLIALGALRPGDRIPTVREIAVEARVNRNTAARAVQYLESEGLVSTRIGRGTFVEAVEPTADRETVDTRIDEAIDRLLVDARTVGLPFDDLRHRLDRRIEELSRSTDRGPETST